MKKKTSKILILMVCLSILLLAAAVACLCLYQKFNQSWMRSVYITLITVFYHFAMRLVVGEIVTVMYRNRDFNMNSFGFRLRRYECKLYRKLHVKKWKAKVLTAKPEQFDIKCVSLKELLHNTLQAELVHRVIMMLSFVPLVMIIPYGTPFVFIVTSVCACLIDLIFVIIQRYNRPRIIKLMTLKEKNVSLC